MTTTAVAHDQQHGLGAKRGRLLMMTRGMTKKKMMGDSGRGEETDSVDCNAGFGCQNVLNYLLLGLPQPLPLGDTNVVSKAVSVLSPPRQWRPEIHGLDVDNCGFHSGADDDDYDANNVLMLSP